MPNLKGVKLKDLAPCSRISGYGLYSTYDEYMALLMNSVMIVDRSNNKPIAFKDENFAKSRLFEGGAVGYDNITKTWYNVVGVGIDTKGFPTQLHLITANGKSFTRPAKYEPNTTGAYIIYALPFTLTFSAMIRDTTNFLSNCDVAINQNLDACKTPYIVVCKDADMQLSLKQAIQQKQEGQAVIVVSEALGDGLKAVNIGAEYLVDKFMEAQDMKRNRLLTKLGIMNANTEKRERVQGSEVNAVVGQATDYIYMAIDTFNLQMDTYGLPFQMIANGSLEEIYLDNQPEDKDENETKAVDVNDVDKKGQIKK